MWSCMSYAPRPRAGIFDSDRDMVRIVVNQSRRAMLVAVPGAGLSRSGTYGQPPAVLQSFRTARHAFHVH